MNTNRIEVQYLSESGWRTFLNIDGPRNPYLLNLDMQEGLKMYPGRRIRAIDSDNRIIDILN